MLNSPVPIHTGLFKIEDDTPVLLGSSCGNCGNIIFPQALSCNRCCSESMKEIVLGSHGTLWSWTIQGFPPKAPYRGPVGEDFTPFGLGYVQMNDAPLLVESRLTICNSADFTIGMPMQLTLEQLYTNEQGQPVQCFSFAPMEPIL